MGYSKQWLALSDEERKIKRHEYNARYRSKYPEKLKLQLKIIENVTN
jgi:hypothetical protein